MAVLKTCVLARMVARPGADQVDRAVPQEEVGREDGPAQAGQQRQPRRQQQRTAGQRRRREQRDCPGQEPPERDRSGPQVLPDRHLDQDGSPGNADPAKDQQGQRGQQVSSRLVVGQGHLRRRTIAFAPGGGNQPGSRAGMAAGRAAYPTGIDTHFLIDCALPVPAIPPRREFALTRTDPMTPRLKAVALATRPSCWRRPARPRPPRPSSSTPT
jgi:hypothetical protein